MTTADLTRQPWSPEDKRLLIEYWTSIGSILLIAMILGRPEGSVQTEASRIGLPRRSEDKGRHRKKWTQTEIDDLDAALNLFQTEDGRIRIIDVANVTGRSIDAVASRIASDFESREEMREYLWIPDDIEEIKRQTSRVGAESPDKPIDSRKQAKMRDCLTCQKPFWSEGAGNRICPRCKADHESSGDWDF